MWRNDFIVAVKDSHVRGSGIALHTITFIFIGIIGDKLYHTLRQRVP